jgi:hypothetical protein
LGKAAVKILKVVDLPAPFGPKSPNIYPYSTMNVLLRMATYPLVCFLKSL